MRSAVIDSAGLLVPMTAAWSGAMAMRLRRSRRRVTVIGRTTSPEDAWSRAKLSRGLAESLADEGQGFLGGLYRAFELGVLGGLEHRLEARGRGGIRRRSVRVR